MDHAVRIYLCGRLAIDSGSSVVLERDFPARQGRLCWSYLVLNRRRPVGRDDLAGAIWDDDLPDGWDTTLSAIVSRLRATLRRTDPTRTRLAIRGDGGRFELIMPPDVFVDFERARTGLHAAETALARHDAGAALAEARVAMEIAARGFLDGEMLPWVVGQRRVLHEIHIHARECLIAAELARGSARLAEREAELLLALDPLNERAYRLQMEASAALGDRAAVLRSLETCRQMLARQAGIEPSAETLALCRKITQSA